MEPAYEFILAVRGLERLLLSLGGFFSILLGTALFKWGIFDKTTLFADAGQWKAQIWNASPGLLFCLFGVVVLCYSLANPLEYDTESNGKTPAPETSASTGEGKPAADERPKSAQAGDKVARTRPPSMTRFRYFSPLPLAVDLLSEVQKAEGLSSPEQKADQRATLMQVWYLAAHAEQLLPQQPATGGDETAKEDGRVAAFRKAMDALSKSQATYQGKPAEAIAEMKRILTALQAELKQLEPESSTTS